MQNATKAAQSRQKGLTRGQAQAVGSANNYNAKKPVAMSFENQGFKAPPRASAKKKLKNISAYSPDQLKAYLG